MNNYYAQWSDLDECENEPVDETCVEWEHEIEEKNACCTGCNSCLGLD